MTSPRRPPIVRPMRLFLIASAATAIAAAIIAAARVPIHANAAPPNAPPVSNAPSDQPIAAEAGVFRTRSGVLAIDPASRRTRSAHPRTLATYRGLRAYPGAPPRIPHGLTPEEYQTSSCKTCHERGGYSERFGAYVPVTPHPELGACLQCHVGEAKLMSVALPNTDPSARCGQCHSEGGMRWKDSSLVWTPLAWPKVTQVSEPPPPPIPHTLQLRGNCLACHSGPSAVAEIQTRHPGRANCRQCHLEGAS